MHSQEAAQADLGKHSVRLRDCVIRGLEKYASDQRELRPSITKRSESSIRHDFVWNELIAEFGVDYRYSEKSNRRLLHLENFNLRFKKLNAAMRPQNVITQGCLDFLGQNGQQLSFPGVDAPTNIDLGYRFLDAAETIPVVVVRCPNGLNGYAWMWSLDEPMDDVNVSPIVSPSNPSTPRRAVALRRPAEEASADGQ